jgi:CheY-like chemotaxis protein/anti-sigma regulatory factor (Ser/Thr protein kinase)
VEIDQVQINQVLYNIIENAKQAMPQGGVIRIEAENCSPADLREVTGQQVAGTGYVLIRVIDRGVGIPVGNIQKIFDPYFSTKGLGSEKGTGLGLTIAHAVIRKHGGWIEVESQPDRGTCMSIYLPTCESAVAGAHADTREDALHPLHPTRRVLFMDDEKMLRDLAEQMLAALGYEAALAHDGQAAVSLYTRAMAEGRPFSLVILDLTVPGGMGGKEVLKQLRKIDPTVRAIVSSGYAADPVMASYRDAGFISILPKPYKIDNLKMVLESVLSPANGG